MIYFRTALEPNPEQIQPAPIQNEADYRVCFPIFLAVAHYNQEKEGGNHPGKDFFPPFSWHGLLWLGKRGWDYPGRHSTFLLAAAYPSQKKGREELPWKELPSTFLYIEACSSQKKGSGIDWEGVAYFPLS